MYEAPHLRGKGWGGVCGDPPTPLRLANKFASLAGPSPEGEGFSRFYSRRRNSLGLMPTVLRKLAAKDEGVW